MGWLLKWLEQYPVQHVVFSVGYLREQVMAYVQEHEWPFSYDFAVEETPLGTGGGIRLALGYCQEDQVFVINGDTFFPVDLNAMPFTAPVTLALKPLKDFERYGTVEIAGQAGYDGSSAMPFNAATVMPDNTPFVMPGNTPFVMPGVTGHLRVTAFHEKRPCSAGLINGGVYAIDRKQLDLSNLPERFSFEKELLEPAAAKGLVGGWISDAYFIDIGVPEDYELGQWAIPAWFAVQQASKAVLAAKADTLFLDRDGVLNRHLPGDYVKSWEQWEWMPGVLSEVAKWADIFHHIVLVTNQRGVGKGLMSEAQLEAIHARMQAEIEAAGGRIDLILTCKALREDDPRRKPQPGMFFEAQEKFPDIDAKSSVMLGDSPSDAAFAQNCGMQFIPLLPAGASWDS